MTAAFLARVRCAPTAKAIARVIALSKVLVSPVNTESLRVVAGIAIGHWSNGDSGWRRARLTVALGISTGSLSYLL